jgi:hypothetical protein
LTGIATEKYFPGNTDEIVLARGLVCIIHFVTALNCYAYQFVTRLKKPEYSRIATKVVTFCCEKCLLPGHEMICRITWLVGEIL